MAEYTDAKKRANKKWDTKNKERTQYINRRSVARNFIKKMATADDLAELTDLIAERSNSLALNDKDTSKWSNLNNPSLALWLVRDYFAP